MLTFDAEKKRYRERKTGRLLTQQQIVAVRNDLADAYAGRLEALVDAYVEGRVRRPRFDRDFVRLAGEATAAGYVFGRGGTVAMTDADYATLLDLVTAQDGYARRFLAEIAAAEAEATTRVLPEMARAFVAFPRDIIPETVGAIRRGLRDQVVARARLYAGAVVKAYEWARTKVFGDDLTLPAQPGDTICDGRCRCLWAIEALVDRWECTWTLAAGAEHCETCLANAQAWSPLVVMR